MREKAVKRDCDFFTAVLEGDELVLEPFCSCGDPLGEDYFCHKCQKHCQCLEILCRNEATLEYVCEFTQVNPHFEKFRPVPPGEF